jgi:hypothetical protein
MSIMMKSLSGISRTGLVALLALTLPLLARAEPQSRRYRR